MTLLRSLLLYLLLFGAGLHLRAQSSSGKITLNGRYSIRQIFKEIYDQAGMKVNFASNLLDENEKLNIKVQNSSTDNVLEIVLRNKNLTFSVTGNYYAIIPLSPAKKVSNRSGDDTSSSHLNGKVRDKSGQPLSGATIAIVGTSKGTASGDAGLFSLNNVPDNAVLRVTFTGYKTQEIPVNGRGAIDIVLDEVINDLDETVIIAYGTTTKRNNVGNVISVKGEDVAKQPVTNPLAALEDRVPGLRVIQQTGVSGGSFNVQIRGKNSLANGNDPLYVIDGVPYTSTLLPSQGAGIFGTNANTTGNPLNFINMNNIESIDVLKDADATAIYGSRGANGVILITTKKGKVGKMAVDVNVNSGIGKVKNRLDFMNTQQYLKMRREAFANDGTTPNPNNAIDIYKWDTTRYTDWQNVIFGRTASFTTAQLGISGGNDLTLYNVSGIYSRQTTVFPGNFSDTKVGVNFNVSATSPNHKFSFLLSGSYTNNINKLPTFDLTSSIDLAPNAPKIYNEDGSVNYENNTFYNPFSALNVKYHVNTDNLISNFTVGYKLTKGLAFKTSFGFNLLQLSEVNSTPSAAINPAQASFIYRSSAFTDNRIRSWIIEPQLTYSAKLWKGNLDALLGTTLQSNSSEGQIVVGSGYTSDALLNDLKSAPILRVDGTSSAVYRYEALFGRVTYNLLNKYLINLTGRRDGSSRFGPENRFHNFGAIGLGWIFSQEDFFSNLSAISFGKIRASMGWTGNDQISDYRFLNLYQSLSTSYQNVTGLQLTSLYNPNLQWEVNRKQEVGLELGFFNNRINFSTSFYRNVASNQLISFPLSSVTGFTELPYNFDAKVQNKGWEFVLTTTNIRKRNFSWTTSANLTIDRNKLLSFPDLENSPYAGSLIVGQPITITRQYSFAGVDPATGLYQFYDAKGGKTLNPNYLTDRSAIINITPRFYGGISNRFSYKGISLDFSLQVVKQKGFYDPFFDIPGRQNHNQTTNILSHWEKPGDNAPYQKYTDQFGSAAFSALNARASDFRVSDASFVRLKNVSLSWQLPAEVCRNLRLQQGRVYVQGQNLLTFTKFKGLDPENQSTANIPPLMMLVGGFQLTF